MGLDFVDEGYGIQSLFPTSDSLGEGFGADGQEAVILDSGKYTEYIQSSELNLGLNILELQAKATITPTPVPNMELEIFSDASGFLNKVDTVNTTAQFNTNVYSNWGGSSVIESTHFSTGYTPDDIVSTYKANSGGYISNFVIYTEDSSANAGEHRIIITQNSIELANKLSTKGSAAAKASYTEVFELTTGDYSSMIQPGTFTVTIRRVVSPGNYCKYLDNYSESASAWSINNSKMTPIYSSYSGLRNVFVPVSTKSIVQTEEMAVPSGVKKFQVVAYKEDTTNDGVIDYDISFDGGAHYKTDLPLGSLVNWDIASSSAIIKINFKTEDGTGTCKCSGFGLRYWGDE